MFKRCAQYHFIAQALSARSDKLIPQRRDKSQFVSPAGLAAALLWLFWPWLWKWRTESSCPGVWGHRGVRCGCITINEHQFINQFLSNFGFLLLFLCVAVTPRSRAGLGQENGPGFLSRDQATKYWWNETYEWQQTFFPMHYSMQYLVEIWSVLGLVNLLNNEQGMT